MGSVCKELFSHLSGNQQKHSGKGKDCNMPVGMSEWSQSVSVLVFFLIFSHKQIAGIIYREKLVNAQDLWNVDYISKSYIKYFDQC